MSRYEIVVAFEGEQKASSQYAGQASGETNGLPKAKTPQKKEKSLLSSVASSLGLVSLAKNVVGWKLDIIGRDSGSTDIQQKIKSIETLATQVVGIGIGFAVNPIAGMAMLTTATIGYAKQYEQYQFERKWEQYTLGEARLRAGVSYNRSRD